jgi:hypothetical protein
MSDNVEVIYTISNIPASLPAVGGEFTMRVASVEVDQDGNRVNVRLEYVDATPPRWRTGPEES